MSIRAIREPDLTAKHAAFVYQVQAVEATKDLPFAAIFQRYGQDFYKIDPMLFSPAEMVFHNLKSGRTQTFGRIAPEILQRSFFPRS